MKASTADGYLERDIVKMNRVRKKMGRKIEVVRYEAGQTLHAIS